MAKTRQLLPAGLAEMPPGPGLAAVLARIDLSRLSGLDCIEVMRTRHRQTNHEQARFMAAMVEVGLCGIGPDEQLPRMERPDEFAADEIRTALAWTRRAADTQLTLAWDLIHRLPAVFAALDAGDIDVPKTRVFSDWTSGLTDDQAQQVCDELLPEAPELTTGQLIDRVKRLAIAIDPDWARRRYEEAVRDRKVIGYRNDDGTANLSGHNLPTDKAAAACAHIDALAKKIKQAGDRRPVDHIKADLYLGMLDGSYTGWLEHDIIAHTLATTAQDHNADTHRREDQDPAQQRPDGRPSGTISPSPDDRDFDDTDDTSVSGGDSGRVIKGPWPSPPPEPPDTPPTRRAGVEIRVEVTTLLGLDEHPAEMPGWGHVHAELARTLVRDQTDAEWRYAVTDDHGRLLYESITCRRPHGYPARADASARGGIVELQISLATLRRLAARPGRLGVWANVIADLAHQADQHEQRDQDARDADEPGAIPNAGDIDQTGSPRNPEHDTQPDSERDERRPAERDREQGRRNPGKLLRRLTQIRDRTCVHPGCRTPASSTDGDHTHDWAHGGATRNDNIGSLCRHDHRLKHEGGWRLDQPASGHFIWRSRLGVYYHVRPPLIIQPLPDPIPRDPPMLRYAAPRDGPDNDDTPTWWEPPESKADLELPPTKAAAPADETPPF